MDIYEIKEGYLGNQISIQENEAIPISWTMEIPPALNASEYAMWIGKWVITTIPPMPPEPMYNLESQTLSWTGSEWLILTK